MKQITINGRVLGVVDVPEGATKFIIHDGDLFWEEHFTILPPGMFWEEHFTILPPGNWSILGRLNDITEEQAAGIVERRFPGILKSFLRAYGITGNPLILLLNAK